MFERTICVSAVGLTNIPVYIAHERGNWGPEPTGGKPSDFKNHRMGFSSDGMQLEYDGLFLVQGEEFKLVVPVSGEEGARAIYAKRMGAGVHVNTRFDFDANHNTLWLLADSHPVVRPGAWNQNNVFILL